MKKLNIKSIVIYTIILVFIFVAVREIIISKSDESSSSSPLENTLNAENTMEEVLDEQNLDEDNEEKETNVTIAETVSTVYDGLPQHVIDVMKKSIELPDPNPIVGVGRGTEFGEVTETAIQNAGGLGDVIEEGDVVLIKPNLCMNARPDTPTTTDYRVVQKVVEMVKEEGASKVIIAEGGFMGKNFSEAALQRNLYNTIEDVEFVNINDFGQEDCYALVTENSILGKELLVPKVYMEADKVITVAKLKTHFQPEAVVTLSIKNCYGAISSKLYGTSNKIGLHNMGFVETMIEINKIRRPDFAVIDGIIGGEGYGPVDNTPVESNIIFAGKDIAAVDTIALNFMGFELDQVPHVKAAGENNLGITDYDQIQVEGANIEEIKMSFDR
ncbi:DUF362 domain-containing protein [Mobilitalea sibirica]|uniref:DUF362 domain-containing protein n=1 Tax=Mobilitalea sibirica TaxID=1462919 RepID=A0A8J7HCA8_9FIRM|nr:DUF362 domain-containing protein [Mobilitalea sibirica]MBH1940792.1 DUF362 domain-containing protein [Mobilitalea sibirica]